MVVTIFTVGEASHRNTVKFRNVVETVKTTENKLPFTETRLLLAILGGLPCLVQPPYWPSLDFKKSTLLYCIIVYSLASWNVAWTVVLKLQQYDEIDPSEVVMRNIKIVQIVLMIPHSIGLILWMDSNDLSLSMKAFIDIQEKFYEATGKKLINRRRSMERFCNAFIIIGPIFFYLFSQNFVPVMNIEAQTAIGMMYGHFLMFLVTFYWIGISFSITDAFDEARIEFEWHINNGDITPSVVYKFRMLWLSIRTALDSMGKLRAPASVYSLEICLIVVVLYEGAGFLQLREILAAGGHLIGAGFYFGIIGLTCLGSHRLQDKMKNLVADVLPKLKFSAYETGTQREIVMLFITENSRPAVTTFQGLTIVNKTLILAFISNISTYIIVLLQFLQKK